LGTYRFKTQGGGSSLRATVKKQWDDHLEDPATYMFVNDVNYEDGNNEPLQW
jgi:hypothetical protein